MKNYSLYFLLAIIFSSCETVVTNDLKINQNDPLLVIEGGIERQAGTSNAVQQIKLTTTTDFLNNGPSPIVENAEVVLYDDQQTYVMEYQGNGIYANADIIPTLGATYRLEINWEDKKYSAIDQLNEVPKIDTIYTAFEEETGITDEGYFVKLDSQDPIDIPNFYYYRVYRNGELIVLPDPGNSRTLILKDEFFDGQNRVAINANEEVVYEPGDLATVDQIGISEAYYNFLFEIYRLTGYQSVSFTGNPPPASISGNILSENPESYKALGFFYAIDVNQRSVIVTE